MLSNAYFLANFRFDTAENEPDKNLQNLLILIFPILPTLTSKVGVAVSGAGVLVAGALAVLAYNYAALRSRREKHELVQCAPAES